MREGRLVGTVRLWHVSAGGIPALVLGPLAVDDAVPQARRRRRADGRTRSRPREARGHGAVILLGDAPYYARFGFSAAKTGELSLPGPFERDRLLGLELREGALDGAWGMIVPTGAPARRNQGSARAKAARRCRTRPDCQHHADQTGNARAARICAVRGTITTILVIMIAVMIVRDILARRWDRLRAGSRRDIAPVVR